jgi:acetyl-CoA carboxylase biotin carboxylase subunit
MRRALDEYILDGIGTTIPFYREILRDEEFVSGQLDTGYIERFQQRRNQVAPSGSDRLRDAALIAGALQYARRSASIKAPNHHASRVESQWKKQGRRAQLESRR